MRKLISILAISTLITGALIISSQSLGRKNLHPENTIFDKSFDENAVMNANKRNTQSQWDIFQNMAGVKIKFNTEKIAALRRKCFPDKNENDHDMRILDSLAMENIQLQEARAAYEQDQIYNEAFQLKFNTDLDALTLMLSNKR